MTKQITYKGHKFTVNIDALQEFNKDLTLYEDLLIIDESDASQEEKQTLSTAVARTAQLKLYRNVFGKDWEKVKNFTTKLTGKLDEDVLNNIIAEAGKDTAPSN